MNLKNESQASIFSFQFQFPRKRKLKIKHQISIVNLQENENQNLRPIFNCQFSQKMENGNLDANTHISIFRLIIVARANGNGMY